MNVLRFESVSLRHVRNLAHVEFQPAPRLSVIAGDNGQGKTSLLEALYLVCTTRSFRTSKLRELVQHGEQAASVRATITDTVTTRVQRVGIEGAVRRVAIDDKRPATLATFATRSPIVLFDPGEMRLSSGPAAGRRTLLDRLALFVDPSSADHRARYIEASRARQSTLERRGADATELDAFEELMARHGSALERARSDAADRIARQLAPSFASLTNGLHAITGQFEPGGPMDARSLQEALQGSRSRDIHRGSASVGPHRDDLVLCIDERCARTDASQGEHRAITLALKLAEMNCIAEACNVLPVLLLDDVSSELDASRTAALFDVVLGTPAQIFVTTTRRELIDTPGIASPGRLDFLAEAGSITVL